MKKIMTEMMSEVVKDDKVATATVGTGIATATGTIMEWLPGVVGLIAAIVSLLLSFAVLYFRWNKNRREEEKHKIFMERAKKNRDEDPSINEIES